MSEVNDTEKSVIDQYKRFRLLVAGERLPRAEDPNADGLYFVFDWPETMRRRRCFVAYVAAWTGPLAARVRAKHKGKGRLRVRLRVVQDGQESFPLIGWVSGTGEWETVQLEPSE